MLLLHTTVCDTENSKPTPPACRERRTKELMAAATKAVQQRRRPALATLETANAVPGVYGWVGSPLKAGARCILAYNCRWVVWGGLAAELLTCLPMHCVRVLFCMFECLLRCLGCCLRISWLVQSGAG